jgi:hypothetical protein
MNAAAPNVNDGGGERELPQLSPEREKELTKRLGRKHTAVPISKMIADLKEQAERLQKQQS